ncbi:MAG: hypothetical protein R2847_02050 [Bacteroidia bacterium]
MRFFRIVLGNLWRFWFFFEAVVTFFLLFPFFVITLSGKAPYHRAFLVDAAACTVDCFCQV